MKLVFTRLAHQDLVRLRQFIAEHDPNAAARAANRIRTVAQLLTDQPLVGRPVNAPTGESRNDIRELPLTFGSSGYVLRYQVLQKQIRVLRIWHAREERRWNVNFKPVRERRTETYWRNLISCPFRIIVCTIDTRPSGHGARSTDHAQWILPDVKYTSLTTRNRRLGIRCAELDTTRQDFVAKLLDRELSADGGTNRNGARHKEQDG